MSARWRPSNKNRKWQNINDLTGSSDKKISRNPVSHRKTLSTNPNYRTAKSYSKRSQQEPKPLIDIFQDNNNITVFAEITGFNKDNVKIDVQNQKITLSAKSKDRRYYKSLNLPKVVIPDAMHTKYKNGVLEIKLKKAEAESHAP